jgi:phosphomannomutase/phosphoglucomutase
LLLAQDHLQRFPGAPVIFTVSNSEILNTKIEQLGGKARMTKVGHSFVEHAMHEQKSLLGGEQSGHFFCGEDYFPFDDALVAALRVLRILETSGKPLSVLLADFPKVYQAPERRPYCHDDEKAEVIKAVTAHFQMRYPVNTLDGARIAFGSGAWAGIRQSNTSPCISVCLEARSPERLQEIEREVIDHLKTYPQLRW